MDQKKSQITIFLILGVVMILVVVVLFIVTRNVAKKTTSKEAIEAKEISFDISPINNFITECLSIVSKDGLKKLGNQGGYLFTSQGGNIVDYTEAGNLFANYKGNKVVYNILKPRFTIGNYYPFVSTEPEPRYPWIYFPYYPDLSSTTPTYKGQNAFGTNTMPYLRSSYGPNSIQNQLEVFVENNIDNCLDFSVFEEQGFKLTKKEKDVELQINEEDVVFKMNYPITVENTISGEKTEIKDFIVKHNVRLEKMHKFVNGLIDSDISDVKFVITSVSEGEFGIEKQENTYGKDDLIIVTDKKSLIDSMPYQYYFMRKNRNPALEYANEMKLGNDKCSYNPNAKEVTCGFVWYKVYATCCNKYGCWCCFSHNNPQPPSYGVGRGQFYEKAEDPDEDTLTYSYEGEENVPAVEGGTQRREVKQTASDGALTDWQTVDFTLSWPTQCSGCCSY